MKSQQRLKMERREDMTHFRQVLMNVNTAAIKADGQGSEENFKQFFQASPA